MGIHVVFPYDSVFGYTVMSLVPVDEYLQCHDTPTLLTYLTEMLQQLHRGIFLDYNYPFFDWGAATDKDHLAVDLVTLSHSLVCVALPVFSLTIAAI